MKQELKNIKRFIIHGSFTRPSQDYTSKHLERDHLEMGINSPMGYHFYIRRDGRLIKGRELTRVGAHAAPWNTNSIGICLEGGMREDFNGDWNDQSNWEDNYTIKQNNALLQLFLDLILEIKKDGSDVQELEIIGHRDVPGVVKKCPGFSVQDKYGWITA